MEPHPSSSPKNAPIELKPSPGKNCGWGVFATKAIKKGSTILTERALFAIRKPHDDITDKDVYAAFGELTSAEKRQFLLLRDNGTALFRNIRQAFEENCFRRAGADAESLALACYLIHSRINHSCVPNAKIPESKLETIRCFATRDITAGEEITFCYETDFVVRTRDERHRILRFVYDCEACRPGTSFQRPSDMRRTLLRGLQYLTLGQDPVGQTQPISSWVIVDPKLKAAAERFEIPVSSRLVYDLLTAALLEEEGLLDDFMIGRFKPGIMFFIRALRTESSARIARLAMIQETWLRKFCTMSMLWGRQDPADQFISMLLQASHESSARHT
ncbi:hypothetical protein BDW68DRAFT_182059 [Aspergillus falconensis]